MTQDNLVLDLEHYRFPRINQSALQKKPQWKCSFFLGTLFPKYNMSFSTHIGVTVHENNLWVNSKLHSSHCGSHWRVLYAY